MRKIIRILVWTLAALVVMTAALLTYLRTADLSVYQPQIERIIARRTGFQLGIAGRFELHFGPVTTVFAQDATLSNPEWQGDTELLHAGHVELAFDTWSLVSGPFIVEAFQANDIRIRVDRSADGRINWRPPAIAAGESRDGELDLNRIAFRTANVERLQLLYSDAARPRPIDVRVETLTVTPDANDLLDLDLQGDVNELPLWADGKLGPWRNFIDGTQISADFVASLGQVSLSIDGHIDDLLQLEGVTLSSKLSGPDAAVFLDRLGLPPFAAGDFEVRANVERAVAGPRIQLAGNLGEIELFAAGSVDRLLRPSQASNDFRVAGPDAHHVALLLGIEGVPMEPFQFTGDYSRSGRLITLRGANARIGSHSVSYDGQIDFSSPIPDVDMIIAAAGPNFAVVDAFVPLDGLPAEPYEIEGRLRKAGPSWNFEKVSAQVGDNRLSIDGSLEVGRDASAEITLRATGPDISFVGALTALEGVPPRPYDVRARLKSDPRGVDFEDTEARFGDNVVRIDGVLTTRAGFDGSELTVSVEGPELHDIRLLTGIPHLPAGAFTASGDLRIEPDFLYVDRFDVTVAELDGTANGRIGIGSNAGEVDLDVTVGGPDASKAAAFEFLQQFGGEPFEVAGNIRYGGDRLEAQSLRVSLGNLQSEFTGSVVGAGRVVDMAVSARTTDSELVGKLARLDYLPGGEIIVSGEVHKTEEAIDFRNVRVGVGEYRFAADGTLSLVPDSNDSDLGFSLSGPNLAELGPALGYDSLPAQPFSSAGRLSGTRHGFAMRDFLATLGESDVRGEFDVDLRDKPQITANLSSSYLDITDKLPPAGDEAGQAPEAEQESERPEFLFSDAPLNTGALQLANVDLTVAIDRLVANTLDATDVDVSLRLVDGALSIDPIRLREGDGGFEGAIRLLPVTGGYSLDVSLGADDLHLGLVTPDSEGVAELPSLTGRVDISGTGVSMREIMASANGRVDFRQGSGKVKDVFATRIFRDIVSQVLRTLNPVRRESGYRTIDCGIYGVSISGGVATIEQFTLQTDAMTVVARGTVDLDTEELDIGFRAKPREGIGISLGSVANSLLRVRGTLRNPSVRLDAKGSVTTTGAAVATGGLSLLARGLWDRLSAEVDVCKQED